VNDVGVKVMGSAHHSVASDTPCLCPTSASAKFIYIFTSSNIFCVLLWSFAQFSFV